MKEILELRINLDYAHLLFSKIEGKSLGGSIKVIKLNKNDPRLHQIPVITKQINEEYNRAFFFGWKIIRKYSNKELNSATLLHLKDITTFEPAGEECGTVYDESQSCPICGCNRLRISSLQLKEGSLPSKDILRTIAGELIVSERFVFAFQKNKLKGCSFEVVKYRNKDSGYFQIIPNSLCLELSTSTIVGINPFDLSEISENEIYKCPNGHTVGLNIISEPHVINSNLIDRYDFFTTKQNIGVKRGLLRPEPLYLCSPSFRIMVDQERLKGFKFEIAHIV